MRNSAWKQVQKVLFQCPEVTSCWEGQGRKRSLTQGHKRLILRELEIGREVLLGEGQPPSVDPQSFQSQLCRLRVSFLSVNGFLFFGLPESC